MKVSRPLLLTSAALFLMGAAALPLSPRLIWNRTHSVPPGLYLVTERTDVVRGNLVAFQPALSEAAWLEAQGYTGTGWPLLKRIAALEGDEVCRRGDIVLINDAPAARALGSAGAGRGMPRWDGCRVLGPGDVFLLADHPRSVDGRYFGVQDRRRILGGATALWPVRQDLDTRPGSSVD